MSSVALRVGNVQNNFATAYTYDPVSPRVLFLGAFRSGFCKLYEWYETMAFVDDLFLQYLLRHSVEEEPGWRFSARLVL
jgi:hypothetical protein